MPAGLLADQAEGRTAQKDIAVAAAAAAAAEDTAHAHIAGRGTAAKGHRADPEFGSAECTATVVGMYCLQCQDRRGLAAGPSRSSCL